MKSIIIHKARQNNLKAVNVEIPLGSFTVVCGLSGSGKSSLAFETLYAEGQRRYLQNLSLYLKQFIVQQNPPDVESVSNIPPALALEQRNNVKSSRSTVASVAGLADHLQLLFEKLASVHCPKHRIPLKTFSPESAVEYLLKNFPNQKAFILARVYAERISSKKDFFRELKRKGFSRLLIPSQKALSLKQARNIEDIKRYPKTDFYLLLDRFVIESKHKNRLRDSFRQAFDLSKIFASYPTVFSDNIIAQTLKGEQVFFSLKNRCPLCSFQFPFPLSASLFNFNSPLGACSVCEGYGYIMGIDEDKVIPQPRKSLKEGAIHPFQSALAGGWKNKLKQYCEQEGIPWDRAWCDLPLRQRRNIWKGEGSFEGIQAYFQSLESAKYKMHIRILLFRYKSPFVCKACKGFKLRPELNAVFFRGKTFKDYMKMTLGQLKIFFEKEKLSLKEKSIGGESFQALSSYLKYLEALGLSYLDLNRPVSSLSGGEFQRLNLSGQLGLCLSQVLYVLDEPTVGLHPRDTARMIALLRELKNLGNTIVVVEHDQDVMKNSDYVIEMGPLAGQKGGEVLWSGSLRDFLKSANSNTAPYLKRKNLLLKTARPVNKNSYRFQLTLKKCSGRNLKNVDLFVPLNRFVVVTGVSGSGKSSLVTDTLYPALTKKLEGLSLPCLPFGELSGADFLNKTVLMNQMDMTRSSRSSVVSYLKAFDLIRQSFAETSLARRKGLRASHFSLNVEGGRCPVCKGLGYQELDMVFMDSLKVQCEECRGKKFKNGILEVRLKKKNIIEVLNLTVAEGAEFFRDSAALLRIFSALKEVGLDYVTLGQSIGSLSGGERQRLKLSRELLKSLHEKTLYILDEPTKGLHFKELEILLKLMERLVDTGGSFLVVEHNLELIKEADYVIDIGPEAGRRGGQIVFEGSPRQLISCKKSHTGLFLRQLAHPVFKK